MRERETEVSEGGEGQGSVREERETEVSEGGEGDRGQ